MPRERCSSWRRIYNTATGCNPLVSYKCQPCQKDAAPENRHTSCHLGCLCIPVPQRGGDKPPRAEAAAVVTPTPQCSGPAQPELTWSRRCGAAPHTLHSPTAMPVTTRCQQKKEHGRDSRPENLSLAS